MQSTGGTKMLELMWTTCGWPENVLPCAVVLQIITLPALYKLYKHLLFLVVENGFDIADAYYKNKATELRLISNNYHISHGVTSMKNRNQCNLHIQSHWHFMEMLKLTVGTFILMHSFPLMLMLIHSQHNQMQKATVLVDHYQDKKRRRKHY